MRPGRRASTPWHTTSARADCKPATQAMRSDTSSTTARLSCHCTRAEQMAGSVLAGGVAPRRCPSPLCPCATTRQQPPVHGVSSEWSSGAIFCLLLRHHRQFGHAQRQPLVPWRGKCTWARASSPLPSMASTLPLAKLGVKHRRLPAGRGMWPGGRRRRGTGALAIFESQIGLQSPWNKRCSYRFRSKLPKPNAAASTI